MSLMRLHDIRKIYPMGDTEVRALDGVDLEVRAGERVGHVQRDLQHALDRELGRFDQ